MDVPSNKGDEKMARKMDLKSLKISRTIGRLVLALIVISMVVPGLVPAALENREPIRKGLPDFVDTTYDLNVTDFREPGFTVYKGKVHVFWMTKSSVGTIRVGNIYTRSFDPTYNALKFDPRVLLTPNSTDTMGNGNHIPTPIVFKDKLYVFWPSGDSAQKPNGDQGETEIIYKVFDGANWTKQASLVSVDGDNDKNGDDSNQMLFIWNEKLYVIWARTILEGNYSFSKIVIRSFDGQYWGKVQDVSIQANETIADTPCITAYKDKLYAVWHDENSRTHDMKVMVNSFDGNKWGTPTSIFFVPDPVSGYISSPRIIAFNNPSTGKEELWGVWMTYGVGAGARSLTDWDIVGKIYDGTTWRDSFELTPPTDELGDQNPKITVFNKKVYVVWESVDPTTKDGKDTDLVMRTNDGYGWSEIILLSRPGDRDVMDSKGEHNLGKDEYATFGVVNNRLVVMFRSFDNVTGRDGTKDIIMRYITDYDSDNDGYMDSVDVFPNDANEWKDTDQDGCGDQKDAYPDDPAKCVKQSTGGNGQEGMFAWLVCFVVVLFMVLVASLIYIFERGEPPKPKSAPVDETKDKEGPAEEE